MNEIQKQSTDIILPQVNVVVRNKRTGEIVSHPPGWRPTINEISDLEAVDPQQINQEIHLHQHNHYYEAPQPPTPPTPPQPQQSPVYVYVRLSPQEREGLTIVFALLMGLVFLLVIMLVWQSSASILMRWVGGMP